MVGSLSSIQPFSYLLTLTSPGLRAILGNLFSGFPGRTISLSVPMNINLAQTTPSHGTNLNHGLVDHRRFISCAQKIYVIRTTGLSICSRTRYHWTNTPRFDAIEANQDMKITCPLNVVHDTFLSAYQNRRSITLNLNK